MANDIAQPIPEGNKPRQLTSIEARYIRDQFREARAVALADAEGF